MEKEYLLTIVDAQGKELKLIYKNRLNDAIADVNLLKSLVMLGHEISFSLKENR